MLKHLIKKFLRSRGYTITWGAPNAIRGVSLEEDLPILISQKNPICLDVGANRGQTIDFLNKVLHNPYIHAFEPSTKSYELIKGWEKNERIKVYNCALGDERCNKTIILHERDDFNSFLKLTREIDNRFSDIAVIGEETVEVDTVTSFLENNNINKVDLLKVDTQGFDLQVLKGAHEILLKKVIQYVIVEVNFMKMYESQSDFLGIHEFMVNTGFNLIDLYEKSRFENRIEWSNALYEMKA